MSSNDTDLDLENIRMFIIGLTRPGDEFFPTLLKVYYNSVVKANCETFLYYIQGVVMSYTQEELEHETDKLIQYNLLRDISARIESLIEKRSANKTILSPSEIKKPSIPYNPIVSPYYDPIISPYYNPINYNPFDQIPCQEPLNPTLNQTFLSPNTTPK